MDEGAAGSASMSSLSTRPEPRAHDNGSPTAQELALSKTLETLIMEREQLVHESARLGQEVRQLRQAVGGDAESQATQILALKEIVAALTRENLQLVQQGGAQLAAPQHTRQPSAVSPSASVNSRSTTRSVWEKEAPDGSTDDFTVVDDDTGLDDGFGRDFSFEVEDFRSELDAAKRCSLPAPEPARKVKRETGPKVEPEPEPEPQQSQTQPELEKIISKLTTENESLRLRENQQHGLVQSLRKSLRASQHEVETLRRSLEERTRALVYWSTQVRDSARNGQGSETDLKVEDLERIARNGAATATGKAAKQSVHSPQDGTQTESRRDPSKDPRKAKRTSSAPPKGSAARQSANSSAAAALSVPKQQSSEPAKLPKQVEEGIPPQQPQPPAQPPAQPVDGNMTTKDDNQPRATRGSAGLSKRASAALSTPVTDSRDSFEQESAATDSGHITHPAGAANVSEDPPVATGQAEVKAYNWQCPCGFKFNTCNTAVCPACDRKRDKTAATCRSHQEAASNLPAKQIPTSYESEEEEDCAGWTTPGVTTPASRSAGTPRAKMQEVVPGPEDTSCSPKVAVTAIETSDPDVAGTTGTLGYITLPGPAHTVTFQTVRKMIEAGAGGALQGKPDDFVFMRAGAPVGRKQEAKFTVIVTQGEPALVVVRAKPRTA